ncbi:Sn1-specific diacylglycerol lipase beta [Orchesella cincta]|uniref:sn-1-specific diacylglycerol lipase n=1 Tax=Orchesella cincta TaxID=48709 RepID=A0A1D2MKX0_ORCCI|nr:Sn1-specific diacylglycerol lipase beta [Orchesella cincta]
MPALVALGRRWQIGSDDFVFPGFVDVLIRVSWVMAGCIIYWKEDDKLSCEGGHLIRLYLVGNFVVLLSIIFANIALVQNSMIGNMYETDARKNVVPCLYLRLMLTIPEIVWNGFGTYWVYSNTIICDQAPETLLLIKILTVSSWVLVFIMLCVMGVAFDPLGGKAHSFEDMDYERFQSSVLHGNSHTKLWERRCKFIMCSCVGIDETHRRAFRDIGKIVGYLFEDVDLVPSDLAAGLVLLNLKNNGALNSLQRTSQGQGTPVANSPKTKNFLEESSYEFETDRWHSPAVVAQDSSDYGKIPSVVALDSKNQQSHLNPIEGDNCCFCNTAALKLTTGVKDVDLLYASFENKVFQTPFFIALDHGERFIVVAIRGTMSLRDAITDLSAEAKPLDFPGIPAGCKAHHGMLLAAKNTFEKINELGTLQRAANNYPTYTVVVTGHSLGAGTAALLSLMLRSTYPNLRCFAYSPPGCLVTEEAANFCESFVTSVIVGDDIVPRLSVPSFEKFKNDLIRAIKESKTPKYRILVGGCWYLLMGGVPNLAYQENGGAGEDGRDSTPLHDSSQDQPNYHTYVSLAEVSHQMQRESVTRCRMFVPGKIMHVTERPIFESRPDLRGDGPRYEHRWASREEFSDIKVTPKMMHDHYPDNVYAALDDIASASSRSTFYSVI